MEKPEKKERPFLNLLINIIIPSLVLMKLSGDDRLGTVYALLLALAFPLFYGLYELITDKKVNFISILGLVSILLTGGIGLLELDAEWIAVKEAAIPLVIGIFVLVSLKTPFPLVQKFIYHEKVFRVDVVAEALESRDNTSLFQRRLVWVTYYLAGSFLVSAILNYVLAKWIVVSPSGTEAFNQELGRMTALSYPVIVLPSMLILGLIFWYLIKTIKDLSGLSLKEILKIEE